MSNVVLLLATTKDLAAMKNSNTQVLRVSSLLYQNTKRCPSFHVHYILYDSSEWRYHEWLSDCTSLWTFFWNLWTWFVRVTRNVPIYVWCGSPAGQHQRYGSTEELNTQVLTECPVCSIKIKGVFFPCELLHAVKLIRMQISQISDTNLFIFQLILVFWFFGCYILYFYWILFGEL